MRNFIRRIRALFQSEPEKPQPWWGLDPATSKTFEDAILPIECYRSKLGSTSHGRNDWRHHARGFLVLAQEAMTIARLGYRVDENGCLRRLVPKRDKSVSPRQAKLARTAARRLAAA